MSTQCSDGQWMFCRGGTSAVDAIAHSIPQSVASDAKRDKAKPRCKINDRIPGTKAQGWFIAPCYAQATKALIAAQLMVKDLALVRKAGHKG